MGALWLPSVPLHHFVVRACVVYFAVILFLRFGGKKQVGQMGTGEFVALLLISNAVQNAMNGGDNSLTGGLILAGVFIVLSAGISYLTFRSQRLENWVEGRPTLLIHNGEVLHRNLEKELITLRGLKVKLRHQGIHRVDEVAEAVLESDGSLSVIKKSEQAA